MVYYVWHILGFIQVIIEIHTMEYKNEEVMSMMCHDNLNETHQLYLQKSIE